MTTKAKDIEHLYNAFHAKFVYDQETGAFYRRKDGKPVGCTNTSGYVHITLRSKIYLAHRVAWLMTHGSCPGVIDHIDGNRGNNRLSNLRTADKRRNGYNRSAQVNNRVGIKGVSFSKKEGKWIAQISIEGKQRRIGAFDDPIEAGLAYQEAAKAHHGFFAFPSEPTLGQSP